MEITPDGYFLDLWSTNAHGESVYPYIKGKKGTGHKAFDVTPTGQKSDYRLMNLDEFLDLLANGGSRAVVIFECSLVRLVQEARAAAS